MNSVIYNICRKTIIYYDNLYEMIKNYILGVCLVVIVACLVKIHMLNVIIDARVIPSNQTSVTFQAICTRVTRPELLNEFISFHVAQGFLTFIIYGDGDFEEIRQLYGNFGLELRFKPHIDNVEWDCLLDAVFDPTISRAVLLNNDEFIFPLESHYDIVKDVETCQALEEYNFVDIEGNDKLITMNTRREIYARFNNKKAIIPIGKTSKDRIELLRNYSMRNLFNTCTLSKKFGVAKFEGNISKNIISDARLLRQHYRVSLGRR